MTTIIGVALEHRVETAVEFQRILTDSGCFIRTRLGLHHDKNDTCANRGIILLETDDDVEELIAELSKFWNVQTMKF